MIEKIVPASVACADRFDDADPVSPFPQEEAVVARAVDERRRSFHTARHCARIAMAQLGLPPGPVLPGERGEPLWPAGTVGSMTHCTGYRGAVLATAGDVLGLGIDAEPHQPLPDGVLDTVSLPQERRMLAERKAQRPEIHWDRLLFSAKESVYKVWFPLNRSWLDFEEADIDLALDGTFTARLLVPEGLRVNGGRVGLLSGRWLVGAGLGLTAIALEAPGPLREPAAT
ncbi:4'-phosphopantetheinyl transferase superfamily protein [Streptomyces sp. H27-C3]|uniref:4'-phosphopantetheinyl transferase family protein n=1 Tax=Streptomyces sp. H27-C3 TaxID=3046305 RepID=UPI0024B8BA50|nr:4'-phosphopantetheinyl transferase superfamily protein [Streptomyces sp. H27-C3]MDJ0464192.1 4'-phosphopantetheinyl transferase superfamily protein [Streptomyces sp. H27-C3]